MINLHRPANQQSTQPPIAQRTYESDSDDDNPATTSGGERAAQPVATTATAQTAAAAAAAQTAAAAAAAQPAQPVTAAAAAQPTVAAATTQPVIAAAAAQPTVAAATAQPVTATSTTSATTPETPPTPSTTNTVAEPAARQTRSMTAASKPISSRLRSSGHLASDHPYLSDLSAHISCADSTPVDPTTHRAAMKSPQAEEWRKAELAELASLHERHVWDLVPRPANANIVTCKWVYKTKEDAEGNTVKRKARLVARGFTQVEGIDYEETFAPTAKFVTIRLIISLATSLGWPMEQADIDNISSALRSLRDHQVHSPTQRKWQHFQGLRAFRKGRM